MFSLYNECKKEKGLKGEGGIDGKIYSTVGQALILLIFCISSVNKNMYKQNICFPQNNARTEGIFHKKKN